MLMTRQRQEQHREDGLRILAGTDTRPTRS